MYEIFVNVKIESAISVQEFWRLKKVIAVAKSRHFLIEICQFVWFATYASMGVDIASKK